MRSDAPHSSGMTVRRASVRPVAQSAPPPRLCAIRSPSRLQLFTGKGGVGKSSVVAALALEAAARGLRPLIVELGHRASMQGVFGSNGIGYEPSPLGHGVSAMNMDFQRALIDYLTEHVKVRAISRAIVDNRALRGFFDAAPAVPEIVTLNRLRQLLDARLDGSSRYHPILVDLDATGHALMLLELPSVLDGLIGTGPLRRLLASLSSMIKDPELTRLHIVTLPGELPAQETIELHAKLVQQGVPLGALIVNQVPEVPFGPEAALLDELEARARRASQNGLMMEVALGRRSLARSELASFQIERLTRALPLPVIRLPLVFGRGSAWKICKGSVASWQAVLPKFSAATLNEDGGSGSPARARGFAPAHRLRRTGWSRQDHGGGLARRAGGPARQKDTGFDHRSRAALGRRPRPRRAGRWTPCGAERAPVAGARRGHGALHAAMLDTSASFDALIRRIGTDPETTRRILRKSGLLRAFSNLVPLSCPRRDGTGLRRGRERRLRPDRARYSAAPQCPGDSRCPRTDHALSRRRRGPLVSEARTRASFAPVAARRSCCIAASGPAGEQKAGRTHVRVLFGARASETGVSRPRRPHARKSCERRRPASC